MHAQRAPIIQEKVTTKKKERNTKIPVTSNLDAAAL
jgi:hypothetical protein